MKNGKPGMGKAGVPFPNARRTQTLRDEDAFMELHGDAGSRLIYCMVDWMASGAYLPKRLLNSLRSSNDREPHNKTDTSRIDVTLWRG